MSEKPDFAELRRKRDEAIAATLQSICEKWGVDPTAVTHCHGKGCYCACPDGPCEHEWGGWEEFDGGLGGQQVCKLCGMGAMSHSMRVGP